MRNKHWMAAYLMCAIAIASCTDSNYDLTDIDSQVRVEVNDFLVPTNVKDIKLEKILDIKEGDRIKKIGNDLYGVIEEGQFDSEVISIKPVEIKRPDDATVNSYISPKGEPYDVSNIPDGEIEVKKYIPTNALIVDYGIREDVEDMEFTANIDEHVTSIKKVDIEPIKYVVSLTFKGMDSFVETYVIENLALYLPKGLSATISDGGTYDPKTGIASFGNTLVSEQGLTKTIEITMNSIDMSYLEEPNKPKPFDPKTHKLNFKSQLKASGSLKVYRDNLRTKMNLKELVAITKFNYALIGKFSSTSGLKVTKFTGGIVYEVDDIKINPIELKNLPDFLAQKGTVIDMKNPQLYLSISNPIQQGVKPNVELSMSTTPTSTYAPFKINFDLGYATNNYCCSPSNPSSYLSGWENAEWKEFVNFGKILAAGPAGQEEIPSEIKVEAKASVAQDVADFVLKDYGKVTGSYKFYAPIELTENSKIAYADSIKGWNDADLDKVTIRTLNLKGNVSTDIPAQIVTLTITPLILKNGKPVFDSQSVTVDLKATNGKIENCPIDCSFTKQIEHLDGIYIKANYNASGKDALRPSQTLKVKDLKVTVSGYYEDKF